MRRIIQLRYPGTCRECGADLAVGDDARYYGRGKIYGVNCHQQKPSQLTGEQRARQAIAEGTAAFIEAHRPRQSAYAAAGTAAHRTVEEAVAATPGLRLVETAPGKVRVIDDAKTFDALLTKPVKLPDPETPLQLPADDAAVFEELFDDDVELPT